MIIYKIPKYTNILCRGVNYITDMDWYVSEKYIVPSINISDAMHIFKNNSLDWDAESLFMLLDKNLMEVYKV